MEASRKKVEVVAESECETFFFTVKSVLRSILKYYPYMIWEIFFWSLEIVILESRTHNIDVFRLNM